MTFSCLKYHFFLEVKIKVTTFVVAKTPCYAFDCSGCSTVGSAPRSGRGGRKFESSHPDKILINECSSVSYTHFDKIAGTKTGHAVFFVLSIHRHFRV